MKAQRLNQGYSAAGSSQGYNSGLEARDSYKPRTVDELRVKTNPKVSYEGRVVSGFKGTRRGMQPVVNKNRVIRFHSYDGTPRLNTTVVNTDCSKIMSSPSVSSIRLKPSSVTI